MKAETPASAAPAPRTRVSPPRHPHQLALRHRMELRRGCWTVPKATWGWLCAQNRMARREISWHELLNDAKHSLSAAAVADSPSKAQPSSQDRNTDPSSADRQIGSDLQKQKIPLAELPSYVVQLVDSRFRLFKVPSTQLWPFLDRHPDKRIAYIRAPRWIGHQIAKDAHRRLAELFSRPPSLRTRGLMLVGLYAQRQDDDRRTLCGRTSANCVETEGMDRADTRGRRSWSHLCKHSSSVAGPDRAGT